MVLNRPPGLKQGLQWIPGIWVGKTEEDDLHTAAASSVLVRGKAVRRTGQPWRSVCLSSMVKEKPYRNPNTRRPLRLLLPSDSTRTWSRTWTSSWRLWSTREIILVGPLQTLLREKGSRGTKMSLQPNSFQYLLYLWAWAMRTHMETKLQ